MCYAMLKNFIGFQYLTSIVPSYASYNVIFVEIDHCNCQRIRFTFIFHHFCNIDKFLFFFLQREC